MGTKLLWIGLTLFCAGEVISTGIPAVRVVGAVIMVVACIIMILEH